MFTNTYALELLQFVLVHRNSKYMQILIKKTIKTYLLILLIEYFLFAWQWKKIFPYTEQPEVEALASFPCFWICPLLYSTVVEINRFVTSARQDCRVVEIDRFGVLPLWDSTVLLFARSSKVPGINLDTD